MRIVRAPAELAEAVAAARREAAAAFGDGTVFVERYVERARHVEVQVLADSPRHGGRARRAGVLDPAPAPEDRRGGAGRRCRTPLRQRLFEAAVAAARAVGYVGAGTVEFLLDADGRVRLPGDEHPAAGRAPGHRGGDRARPGRAAAARSPRARRCRSTRRRRCAGTRSRSGSTPRTRPRAGARRPARCTGSRCPADGSPAAAATAGVVDGDACRRALRPDAGQAGRLGADPGRGRPAARRRAGRRRAARASPPTGTCWCGCCGGPGSRPAPTPASWTGSPRCSRRCAGPAEVAAGRRWPAALAGVGAGRRAAAPVQRDAVPAGWRERDPSQPATAHVRRTGRSTVTVDLPAGAGDRSRSADPGRGSCSSTDGVRRRVPGARGRATMSYVDGPGGGGGAVRAGPAAGCRRPSCRPAR